MRHSGYTISIVRSKGGKKVQSLNLRSLSPFFMLSLLLFASCSSAPKNKEPAQEISKAASEHAVFGNKFYRQGRYREAEEMYLYSLEYYKRIDNRSGIVKSYNSLGKIYITENRLDLASRVFEAAMEMVAGIEQEGVLPPEEIKLLKAETYSNLGEISLKNRKEMEALDYFTRGIEVIAELKEPKELAVLLHNRGGVYKQRKEYELARKDFLRALEMNSKKKRYQEMASNHYMLSSTASNEGDYESAHSHGLKALELDKKTENSVGIAQDLLALGHISVGKKKNAIAADYYMRAYRIYDSLELEAPLQKVVDYLESIGAASRISEESIGFDTEIHAQEPAATEFSQNGTE